MDREFLPEWRLLPVSYRSVFRNLALEEALVRCSSLDGFSPAIRLWRNPACVVVGRFQDVKGEVDVELCERYGIVIGRRFTGGGAVFHDAGTLNISIITRREPKRDLQETTTRYSTIILDLLARQGLEGTLVPPNSIHLNGKKICGAAAALGKHFAFWYASILVSTDISRLETVLEPSRKREKSRWVHSNWHEVTSLTGSLGRRVALQDVETTLLESCRVKLGGIIKLGQVSEDEEKSCFSLHEAKYSEHDWNWNPEWVEGKSERKSEEAHTTIAV